MKTFQANCFAGCGVLFICALFSGCNAANTVKPGPKPTAVAAAAPEKSIQEVADEALRSSGQLSQEQINALIRANAKCSPNDPRYNG